jgi:chromosomal replication initiation ATPase DnaA
LSQLILPLQADNDDFFSEENFLFLEENKSAKNFLDQFFAQKNFSTAKLQSLIIKGEIYSGKSHLIHIFAKKFGALYLNKGKIAKLNLVNFFIENNFYIFEDFDDIKNEELILRLINSASESKAFLVLTTRDKHKFQLKDLVSRLKNIPAATIQNPNPESLKQLLVNGFSRRQIRLSGKIIDFISSNIPRTYEAVFLAVKKVEKFCEESGKSPSFGEIRNIITNYQLPITN